MFNLQLFFIKFLQQESIWNMDIKQALTVDMIREVENCFKKYADFTGRASMAEFWYFILFLFIMCALSSIISDALSWMLNLVFLLPSLSVGARRLHDIGRTAWWMLLVLTIIGSVFVLFLCAQQGEDGDNQYGAKP